MYDDSVSGTIKNEGTGQVYKQHNNTIEGLNPNPAVTTSDTPPPKDVYTVKTAKNGRTLYFKNGRLVSKEVFPQTIDQGLVQNANVDSGTFIVPPDDCLFCGQKADYQRFIHLKTINLCQEHYRGKTTGEVAQALKGEATT